MADDTEDIASEMRQKAKIETQRKPSSRRSFLRGLGVTASALALPGTALATRDGSDGEDVDVHRDITFAERPAVGEGSHTDGELRLDLYLPQEKNPKPRPVLVYIHGGMWLFGAKDADPYLYEHLARQGFAVASIEYRFIQEGRFPAQIRDVRAAIRWLRAHASEYDLDGDNVGTLGSSAGGHLSALAGVTNGVDEFEGDGPHTDYSSHVQAAGSWFGLFALHKMVETAPPESDFPYEQPQSPESRLVGETIEDNPEAGKYASPITYLDKDDPPLLLYHGKDDGLVGYGQSELMYEKARELCHDSSLYLLDSLGHSTNDVYSALESKPPAEGTTRTVHCRPSENAPDERTKDGPVASMKDVEQFYRKTLRD
ncbi:alpha/beta hydrolase fold domain-containing protein [Halobacterium sp. R2-5]|uniref:alpha/beta hydrolase fold domain-containing protein n=1 Tax=Halobacterium sp. R2-5 TaxID=2715751 RepID=UPI00141F0BAF|nr:alpha/beta hydrolase fold domain-containing protein [Halobacterium sp. R2-5]NIB98622.1 alpha/beta hydrolase fold domain-containing protein [Halobacterium sp. R2-5]